MNGQFYKWLGFREILYFQSGSDDTYLIQQTIVNEAKCKGDTGQDESVGDKNTVSGMAEDSTAGTEEDEEEEEEEGSQHQSCHSVEEDNDGERSPKRIKTDHPALRSPTFYFNLHRHSPKGKSWILSLIIISLKKCWSRPPL